MDSPDRPKQPMSNPEGSNPSAERLIFMWSLKRSGSHAVEQWLHGHTEKFCYFNNQSLKGKPLGNPHRKRTCDRPEILMISFEDYLFFQDSQYQDIYDYIQINQPTLSYTRLVNIVVLRDPFNHFASRLEHSKHPFNFHGQQGQSASPLDKILPPNPFPSNSSRQPIKSLPHSMKTLLPKWKMYAREFLGETHNLPEVLPWNYNRWFVDSDYRKSLAASLGLEFTDAGKNHVGMWGSSFDGRNFDGKAEEMKVLERWKVFANEPLYLSIFDDEIIELSRRIFNFAPEELTAAIKSSRRG